jgi:phage protein U
LWLHVEFIAPRPTLTALRRLMALGQPVQVWTDAGSYLGTFVLKDVTWRNQWTLPSGQVIAMTVDVNLGEPGDNDITEAKRPPGVAAYAAPVPVTPRVEDTSRDPATVAQSEIVRA